MSKGVKATSINEGFYNIISNVLDHTAKIGVKQK